MRMNCERTGQRCMDSLPCSLVIFGVVLGVIFAALTRPHGVADEMPKQFRAGAVAIDITPESFPVSSSGSMTHREAIRAHDPLHARCLVLDNGETSIALVTCDSCMIPREIYDEAKTIASEATGIRTDHMLCSATHTHTAVSVAPTFQSEVQHDYIPFLTQQIAKGIVQAHSRLKPAKVGWAVGNNPRQVFNRRWFLRPGTAITDPFDEGTDRVRMNPSANSPTLLRPAGPIDPEIPVLSVQDLEGQPIAVWGNYSLHYVGGVPSESLSADYFGEFARQVTQMLESDDARSPVVVTMTNGTSGDINNVNFFEGHPRQEPFEQIRVVANDVATSAMVAHQRTVMEDWVSIDMLETELELGVRHPTEEDITRAKNLIAEAGSGPWSDRRLIYANETLDLVDYPDTVTVKLQAIRIGDLAIVSSPCETFVETGLAIKKASPFQPTFTIELANGYNGYLPTPEQHALGGYETWRAKSSYLAVDAEPKVRETLLGLLNELKRRERAMQSDGS